MVSYTNCQYCGKSLTSEEYRICIDCRDQAPSAVGEMLTYLDTYLKLPQNHASEYTEDGQRERDILVARSAIMMAIDRVLEQQFDNPVDILMDFMLEIHNYEKMVDAEPTLWNLDIMTGELSSLRHYLMNLGYGDKPISRY